MKINVYPETCCELCNDTIHNHIDCPACGKKYASTDAYYNIMEDVWDLEEGKRDAVIITCQECKTEFKFISRDKEGWVDEAEWEQLRKYR